MTKVNLIQIARTYKNNGQHAEQIVRYTLTGEICKADNKPATECGDCLNIQIKSARATICKGNDLMKHLETDAAEQYGYVNKDFSKMYLMSRDEYIEFVEKFGYITKGSSKENHCEKIRLKDESRAMTEWLEERA